ncbi:MAG: Yip1 family protein [Gemmobacter sp.]
MEPTLASLRTLVRQTVTDPRAGARQLMTLGLPVQARWTGLILVAVISALLFYAGLPPSAIERAAEQEIAVPLVFRSPFVTAGVQTAVMVVMAFAVWWVGMRFGGRGRFEDGLLLVVWLQFVLVCVQLVQLLAAVLVPPLAGLIGLAALVLFLWLLTNFVAELHGFDSLGKVFFGIMLTAFAIAFGLAVVMSFIGAPGV